LFKQKQQFKLFKQKQELCKGALPSPEQALQQQPRTSRGTACLFWKGWVLHTASGSTQLRLRPRSNI